MTKKEITKSLCGYPAALNVKETAQILRVSTKTVYKLIAEGKLPAVKVGRENRIAKSELIQYLRQGEKTSSCGRRRTASECAAAASRRGAPLPVGYITCGNSAF